MKNGVNKNGNQEKKFANPWRQSLPSLPQKPKFRNLKRAILILLAFFVLAIAVPRLYNEIYFRWQYRDLIAQNKAFERDYIKYSGKTPQEVYEKYVSALKRGDIEEAIKYYRDQRDAKDEKGFLEKLKTENNLEDYANNLPEWEELKEEEFWNKDVKKFIYTVINEKPVIVKLPLGNGEFQKETIPAGEYKEELAFYFDSSKKIWKLYDL